MSNSTTTCPHCGKVLSSPDKLAWHLARDCTELVAITQASISKNTPAQSGSGN